MRVANSLKEKKESAIHHLSQEANKDFNESDLESYSMYIVPAKHCDNLSLLHLHSYICYKRDVSEKHGCPVTNFRCEPQRRIKKTCAKVVVAALLPVTSI